jgi:DNA-binding NarL/FixJ family response regulator
MSDAIRVVLADDHAMVRHGLRVLVEAEPDMKVVGEAADGLEVWPLVQRLAPEVLVLDLVLPGLGGLDVAREVSRRAPRTRIVVLSMHDDDAYVLESVRRGAIAYVPKGAPAAELVRAIRSAAAGRRYVRDVPDRAIDDYLRKASGRETDVYELLTTREREVLHMVAEGLSSAGIAPRLGISPRTVEAHRASLMRKLGLKGRAELIRFALSRGIVPLDPPPAATPRGRSVPWPPPGRLMGPIGARARFLLDRGAEAPWEARGPSRRRCRGR